MKLSTFSTFTKTFSELSVTMCTQVFNRSFATKWDIPDVTHHNSHLPWLSYCWFWVYTLLLNSLFLQTTVHQIFCGISTVFSFPTSRLAYLENFRSTVTDQFITSSLQLFLELVVGNFVLIRPVLVLLILWFILIWSSPSCNILWPEVLWIRYWLLFMNAFESSGHCEHKHCNPSWFCRLQFILLHIVNHWWTFA